MATRKKGRKRRKNRKTRKSESKKSLTAALKQLTKGVAAVKKAARKSC